MGVCELGWPKKCQEKNPFQFHFDDVFYIGSQCDIMLWIPKLLVLKFYCIKIWTHVKVIKQGMCAKSQLEPPYFQYVMNFWKTIMFKPK